jgi:choline dehydrogenase-like flavoprotein
MIVMGLEGRKPLSKGPEVFDVCIIGSGAAGGVMAKELCESGAKVIMLEAGRKIPNWELLSHKWPYNLPYRGLRNEKQAPFYRETFLNPSGMPIRTRSA